MNNRRNLQWTEIDTSSSSDDTRNLELDLTKDLEEDNTGEQKATQDTRRSVLTVSKESDKDKENKDNAIRTESEEDQEERTVSRKQTRQTDVTQEEDDDENKGRGGRAHKRIQTLLGRQREKDEMIARLARENEELKKRTRGVERKATETMRDQLKTALEDAETQLEAAFTANDTAKTAKLTRQIADLTMKYNAYQAVSDEFDEEKEEEPTQTRQQPQIQVPDEAKAWIKRNPWFQTDEKRHVLARMISRDLTAEGEFEPSEPEYWEELDKRMASFGSERAVEKKIEQKQDVRQTKRTSGPVGSRSEEDSGYSFQDDPQFTRTGNRVKALPNQDDYDTAEKLGVNIDDLMYEKFKYAKQGYKGYVPIDIPGQTRKN